MRLCELREKEVINISDCVLLGFVSDIEFRECDGCITALVVPGPGKFFGFLGRDCEMVIPWKDIVKIGPDIILVDVKEPPKKHPL